MPPTVIVALLVVAGIFVVVQIFIAQARARRRREELARVADGIGLEYSPEGRGLLPSAIESFPLLKKDRGGRASNVLHGTIEDMQVLIFDYRYTVGSGKNARTYSQTVAAVGFDQPRFPDFEVRPERFLSKLAQLVGYQDIDFHTHPEFSRRYLVRGRDEHAVRCLFSQGILDHLQRHEAVCLEGGGRWLIMYLHDTIADPAHMGKLVEESFEMATLFTHRAAA